MGRVRVLNCDVMDGLRQLADESVHCVVTSPPYWGLRDYGVEGQIGLESSFGTYVTTLSDVFDEVRRVLRDDGTLWLNLGDCYAGSRGAQSREHAGKHAPNVSALSANQVKAAGIRASGTGSMNRTPGLKPKDMVGIPWRVAFALQARGWWLRSDIIWSKPNPMPESVTDRPTKAHEYVFLLTKSDRYFYDAEAIREPLAAKTFTTFGAKGRAQGNDAMGSNKSDNWGKSVTTRQPKLNGDGDIAGANKRTVWTIATAPFPEAHFATFPPALPEICIKAGCPVGGTVLDPFGGAGTTGLVADRLQRNAILIELNPEYAAMAEHRINGDRGPLLEAMETADAEG